MLQAEQWLLELVSRHNIPVLAVCFGHQLLGKALGADVIPNPKGAELGTIQLSLSSTAKRDPLFASLPEEISVQSIHKDIVVQFPNRPEIVPFGGTENTDLQGFALGQYVRSVQFHPELSKAALSMLLRIRNLDAQVQETEHGSILLKNWFQNWVCKDRSQEKGANRNT